MMAPKSLLGVFFYLILSFFAFLFVFLCFFFVFLWKVRNFVR